MDDDIRRLYLKLFNMWKIKGLSLAVINWKLDGYKFQSCRRDDHGNNTIEQSHKNINNPLFSNFIAVGYYFIFNNFIQSIFLLIMLIS